MLRNLRIVLLTMPLMAPTAGCGGSDVDYQFPVYDACYDVYDCIETATLCEELSVDFAGYSYVNAICTLECAAGGALSPDCPRAWVGRWGSCYPSSIAGGIDDTLVCFEPCDDDGDCQSGFRCLRAIDLCGRESSCPVDAADAICVPGPF
jgi:hypothetical protein